MSKRKQTAIDEMRRGGGGGAGGVRVSSLASLNLPIRFSCGVSSFIRLPEIHYYIIFVIYMSE